MNKQHCTSFYIESQENWAVQKALIYLQCDSRIHIFNFIIQYYENFSQNETFTLLLIFIALPTMYLYQKKIVEKSLVPIIAKVKDEVPMNPGIFALLLSIFLFIIPCMSDLNENFLSMEPLIISELNQFGLMALVLCLGMYTILNYMKKPVKLPELTSETNILFALLGFFIQILTTVIDLNQYFIFTEFIIFTILLVVYLIKHFRNSDQDEKDQDESYDEDMMYVDYEDEDEEIEEVEQDEEEAMEQELFKQANFEVDDKVEESIFDIYIRMFIDKPWEYLNGFLICDVNNPKMETILGPIVIVISAFITNYVLVDYCPESYSYIVYILIGLWAIMVIMKHFDDKTNFILQQTLAGFASLGLSLLFTDLATDVIAFVSYQCNFPYYLFATYLFQFMTLILYTNILKYMALSGMEVIGFLMTIISQNIYLFFMLPTLEFMALYSRNFYERNIEGELKMGNPLLFWVLILIFIMIILMFTLVYLRTSNFIFMKDIKSVYMMFTVLFFTGGYAYEYILNQFFKQNDFQ